MEFLEDLSKLPKWITIFCIVVVVIFLELPFRVVVKNSKTAKRSANSWWFMPKSNTKINGLLVPKQDPDLCSDFGYLSVDDGGRFGNKISQYASLYALARDYGVKPVITSSMKLHLRMIFENTNIPAYDPAACEMPFCCQPFSWRLSKSLFDDLRGNVKIAGHPNEIMSYVKYRDALLYGEFKFHSCLVAQAKDFIRRSKRKHKKINSKERHTMVGVHVRRGDYEKHLNKDTPTGGHFLSSKYYIEAMDYFRVNYDNVVFVIASDDQDWCHQHLKADDVDFTEFVQNNKGARDSEAVVGFDLAVLSRMDHSIISYGTFSFWSAFLKPRGTTIFYQDFYYRDFPGLVDALNTNDSIWLGKSDPCSYLNKGRRYFRKDVDCIK